MKAREISRCSERHLIFHVAFTLVAGGATALLLASQPAVQMLALALAAIVCARMLCRNRQRRVRGVLAVEAAVAISGGQVSIMRHARAGLDVP